MSCQISAILCINIVEISEMADILSDWRGFEAFFYIGDSISLNFKFRPLTILGWLGKWKSCFQKSGQYRSVLRLKNMYGYLFPGPLPLDFFTLDVAHESTMGLACHCFYVILIFKIFPLSYYIVYVAHTKTSETFFYYDSTVFHEKGVKQFRK